MPLVPFSNRRFRGLVDPALEPPPVLLEDPEKVEDLPGVETLLACEGRHIFRLEVSYAGDRTPAFLYCFHNGSWSRTCRRTAAIRIARKAQQLRAAGIPTLDVWAAFRPKYQLRNRRSYLVAAEIPDVAELPAVGCHIYQLHSWTRLDPTVLLHLAGAVARLHSAGFTHGDLKARHVLVRRMPHEEPVVYLVDLEKTAKIGRLPAPLRDALAARDWIQLLASLDTTAAVGDDGRPVRDAAEFLLERYFALRSLAPRRRRRIRRFIELYRTRDGFRQGATLLQNLWWRLTRNSRATASATPRLHRTGPPTSAAQHRGCEPAPGKEPASAHTQVRY
ncbi:MAG: hypothetical protein Kow00109_08020 [Acidobacteriota bacterium]